MPYRRLPNTDLARLRSLQNALQRAEIVGFNEQVIPYKLQSETRQFLVQLENAVLQSKENYTSKVSANKQYRHIVQKARMYVSHFIQVLNLAVIRGEIKKEQKRLYGLDPENHFVPDLSTDECLMEWGQKIIDGELKRTQAGGFAIYNPAISKVKVHYDIFCEHMQSHQFRLQNTNRVQGDLGELRKQADALILQIWDLVEHYFRHELPFARMQKCKEYGVIYYYRKGEKKLSAETDRELKRIQESQPTIQWSAEE